MSRLNNCLKRQSKTPRFETAEVDGFAQALCERRVQLFDIVWVAENNTVSAIALGSRKVNVAGVTPHPSQAWMMQIACNVTMEEWGFLSPGQYLIHDRDTKFCAAFQHLVDAAGVTRVPLPPRSPNLNAYAERWVRSVKEE